MKFSRWHVGAALGVVLVMGAGGLVVAQQTSPGNDPVVQTPPQEPPPPGVEMPPQEKAPTDIKAPPTKDAPEIKAPEDKGDKDKADDDNNNDDDEKATKDHDGDKDKGDDSKVAKLDVDGDEPVTPRPRHGAAIIQALDKITTETMRFEAPVGKPIKFKGLVFTVKSCETSAPEEKLQDSIAYLQVRAEPKVQAGERTSREVFSGWMFASSPGLDALQHPVYDAWLIACKA